MSRLDKFEEILKSYEGRASGENEKTILFRGVPLLRSDYEALNAVLKPAKITPEDYLNSASQIECSAGATRIFNVEDERIVELEIGQTKLSNLAQEIGQLDGLRNLYLIDNKLKSLPESIGLLVNLDSISLGGNKLVSLPDSMKNLRKLTIIEIIKNKFQNLPAILLELPKLEEAYCRENPIDYENDPVYKQLQKRGIVALDD